MHITETENSQNGHRTKFPARRLPILPHHTFPTLAGTSFARSAATKETLPEAAIWHQQCAIDIVAFARFLTEQQVLVAQDGWPDRVRRPGGHGELCRGPDRHGRYGQDVRREAVRRWLEVSLFFTSTVMACSPRGWVASMVSLLFLLLLLPGHKPLSSNDDQSAFGSSMAQDRLVAVPVIGLRPVPSVMNTLATLLSPCLNSRGLHQLFTHHPSSSMAKANTGHKDRKRKDTPVPGSLTRPAESWPATGKKSTRA